jgi:hypothetical protein
MRYAQWSAKQPIERHAAGILKHQRHAVVDVRQRDGSRREVSVKFNFECKFVFEPRDATKRGVVGGNEQDRRQAIAGAPVERCLPPSAARMRSSKARSRGPPVRRTTLESALIRLRLLWPVNPKKPPLKIVSRSVLSAIPTYRRLPRESD